MLCIGLTAWAGFIFFLPFHRLILSHLLASQLLGGAIWCQLRVFGLTLGFLGPQMGSWGDFPPALPWGAANSPLASGLCPKERPRKSGRPTVGAEHGFAQVAPCEQAAEADRRLSVSRPPNGLRGHAGSKRGS